MFQNNFQTRNVFLSRKRHKIKRLKFCATSKCGSKFHFERFQYFVHHTSVVKNIINYSLLVSPIKQLPDCRKTKVRSRISSDFCRTSSRNVLPVAKSCSKSSVTVDASRETCSSDSHVELSNDSIRTTESVQHSTERLGIHCDKRNQCKSISTINNYCPSISEQTWCFRKVYPNLRHLSRIVTKPVLPFSCKVSTLTLILKFLLVTTILQLLSTCQLYVSAVDFSKQELNLEQSIAAVFNKVAYGSSTTKRSIPENWSMPQISTLATPLLTTYKYQNGNEEWLRVDVDTNADRKNKNDAKQENRGVVFENGEDEDETDDDEEEEEEEEDEDIEREDREKGRRHYGHRHRAGSKYEAELEKDHALPTSAPNADILKGNTNKHYGNPNRYANERARHNLQVYGRDRPPDIGGAIRTYPETRRPSSLLESDPSKIASTQSSYNLLRNINPTPPMHRSDLPSYSPPSRAFFTPPLPPEYLNPFADKPTLKGTNSGGSNYANRRPIPPPSIMPKHDRIPFRPDLPQSANVNNEKNQPDMNESNRKIFQGNPDSSGKKKVLNTPSLNTNLQERFGSNGEFLQHTPVNESQFEYEPMVIIPSISRILSGSNGRKDAIPDVLLRTVTAKPSFQPPSTATRKPTHEVPRQEPKHHHETSSKFVEDEIEERRVVEEKIQTTAATLEGNKDEVVEETTFIIEHDIQNLPNVNRDKNNFQNIYSTKSTFLNSTSRDNFYTWNVSWNLHVYLTAILFTLLAVYSIYKIIRFDKLTHLFHQGYFIVVHLLLTTICVSRIFYLIYDPYNINLSFPKFISDIFLNLPLSLLAIAFATLYLYLLKRTLNKTHFKVKPIFVIIFSFAHIFLCISLHLLENFDILGKNDHLLSLICQFIYVLLCLFLGFSYLYLYKIIKKVLAKKSQNFSELSVQNLSYATHITIAIALLFVLMSVLQIYGIFGIRSHENFTNLPPFKWLAWGFQFSIRLIEISIVALLSWVVSLKLSVREKNIENNLSGFALFPCANSNSTVDNEIYPAICQTNQNVHNFTLRSGKSLYEDNFPLNNMDGIPQEIIGRPNLVTSSNSDRASVQNFERGGSNNFERGSSNHFERAGSNTFGEHGAAARAAHFERNFEHGTGSNRFERSNYERSSNNLNSTNYDREASQQRFAEHFERNNYERGSNARAPHFAGSNQGLNSFDNRYNEDNSQVEDHYEDPDFEVERTFRRSKRNAEKYTSENSDSCSVNSRSNSVLGVQKVPQFGNLDSHDQGVYNEPIDQQEYNFQNYERPNFDRPNSRTNSSSYSSKHRSDKRSGSSSSNSGTFERRSMRKSGTLNDFGDRKHGAHYRNGVQTLNSVQKVHSYGTKNNAKNVNVNEDINDSMLVDEQGFVRFRNMSENKNLEHSRRSNSRSREHKNKNMYNNT